MRVPSIAGVYLEQALDALRDSSSADALYGKVDPWHRDAPHSRSGAREARCCQSRVAIAFLICRRRRDVGLAAAMEPLLEQRLHRNQTIDQEEVPELTAA
jgi:hypothetical protein